MRRNIVRVLLVIAIVIPIGIILHDAVAYVVREKGKETATGTQDTTGLLADYDCKIFGQYRFNRSSSRRQNIYMQAIDNSGDPYHDSLAGGGAIEKYMHDGERYIAYHLSEVIETETDQEGVSQIEPGEQYYAILDTQTKQSERFTDIEALSEAIRVRQMNFGSWFYTSARNSAEGIRTPLFGDYAFEYVDRVHGQNILRREIPVFYGVLDDVQTDGIRFISFRARQVHETNTWYLDPITNALLSSPSNKRIGTYRRGFLDWYSVYYDQYVLFDTLHNTAREFEKERELKALCDLENISLQAIEIRKQ